MIELAIILSMVSGWLLIKFYKQLVDLIVDILANGYMVSMFSYGLIRSFL